jgi:hypothetical protein
LYHSQYRFPSLFAGVTFLIKSSSEKTKKP